MLMLPAGSRVGNGKEKAEMEQKKRDASLCWVRLPLNFAENAREFGGYPVRNAFWVSVLHLVKC